MNTFRSPTHPRKKFEYVVCSVAYKGKDPVKATPTGRKVLRAPQVLFDPDLKLFGLNMTDRRVIADLEVGDMRTDCHGDHWRRVQ